MQKLIVVFVICTVVSCAPIYVSYDYDKNVDITTYKTYQYFGDIKTGLNELDTKRLLDALDEKLKANGLTISDTPDFLIDIKSIEYQNPQRQTVGVGVGGGNGNAGGGISIGLPIGQPQTTREIIFDFVDAKNKQLFWQAKSEAGFSTRSAPSEKKERLKAIVEKVFKKYPPDAK